MIDFIRKIFSPTFDERLAKENFLAERLFEKIKKRMWEWANNPVESVVYVYIGTLNKRVENDLIQRVRDHILHPYHCLYSIENGYYKVHTKYDTYNLILEDGLKH